MSQSTSLAGYRAALSTPGARRPMIASVFARLPIAMIGLSAMLYVQRVTSSFAVAGFVSAASLLGVAIGAVVQGRLIDRFGPTRPLLLITALFAVALSALALAIEAHAATALLILLGLGIGITEPMVASASRALWGRLIADEHTKNAAFAYEAISMEVFFVLGPGLAGLLVAAPWAGTGMVFGGVCMVTGSIMFALSPTVRAWGPARREHARTLLGALASPGMRALATAALGFGVVIGFVEVAVPAAATDAGAPAVGGVLLSIFAVGSVAFGVVYSLRPWPRRLPLRLPLLLAAFGLLVALAAWPSTLWALAVAMLAAGSMVTPQSATHSTMIEVVAPKGTAAEAFGWVVTAITLGLAIGQSTSGYLAEHRGPAASFLTAGGAGLLIAAVVWLLRDSVTIPDRESVTT